MEDRVKKMVKMYENRIPLSVIGKLYGISRQRVYQLIERFSPESIKKRKFPTLTNKENNLIKIIKPSKASLKMMERIAKETVTALRMIK